MKSQERIRNRLPLEEEREHHDRPSPDFVGGIHSANEGVAIYDLMEALQIYILAILELQKLEY